MSSKSALKAVRAALDSRDFEDAAAKAKDIVKQEPQNYHAYACLRFEMGFTVDVANCVDWLLGTSF